MAASFSRVGGGGERRAGERRAGREGGREGGKGEERGRRSQKQQLQGKCLNTERMVGELSEILQQ